MSPSLTAYLCLAVAIMAEVTGSAFLQRSAGFTRLWPTLGMLGFYVLSFWLLSQALRVIPLGFAYAIWSGLGIILTALIGLLVFRQRLDGPALAGMALIIAGVLVMNLFSKSGHH